MAGTTICPIPKTVVLKAFHYPRVKKRSFFYSGLLLITFCSPVLATCAGKSTLKV
jgi:hypothetical protein